MHNDGSLHEKEGRSVLVFERHYPIAPEKVFLFITDPQYFRQWYPFATGDMDLKVGGKIKFDDGEGSTYEAEITEINPPYSFCFKEMEDLLEISIQVADQGCTMTFSHTFDDRAMAKYTAAGWHRCLDALGQLIHGQPLEWEENGPELREYYKEKFE
ncbi:SRPBCC family protein [Oceanobacillus jordanicus]|uniref:SRPBCC family protein n=1 Tax=Oceanobacillus jordanicus TaxID=2867266 RepID=A0AAW5B296_9BACI|nr:SRPBCC family protein [Oceanobacillus jordanicus]MCG3418235.1 SRPBCC family protein [Oceanobacillus jordanicus]